MCSEAPHLERHRLADNSPQLSYDDLIRLYGEAMIRVGELEAKIADLNRQRQGDLPGPENQGTSASTSDELQALADKIDTFGRRMADPGDSGAEPGSQPSEEFSELRLQITSMSGQLAVAQSELAKLRGNRRRRSHRDHSVPWWKALGRRLGIGKHRRP